MAPGWGWGCLMANEQRTVLEGLSQAVHSSDLSHRRGLCDADFIHGLGMAGQRTKQGTALLDLHMTLSREDAAEAMKVAQEVTREVAKRRGWAMTPMKVRKVAAEALALYLRPACAPCKGRGMLNMDMDKPGSYHPKPCPACSGSGKRPFPLQNRREISAVLYVLEDRMRAALWHVKKAMSLSSRPSE